MRHDKKKTAALTAVLQLIQAEAETAAATTLQSPPPTTTATSPNLWGLSGRQAQMQLRNLLQLKAFSNPRLR